MKKTITMCVLAAALAAPAALVADHHEAKEETYIYGTYFYCDTAEEDKADAWVKQYSAPAYDAAVADGTLKGWGWVAHHSGGKWRRIQYHTSGSIEGLLSAQEAVGKKIDEAAGSGPGMNTYCSEHDDYIWQVKGGSVTDAPRGKAAISVYYVCSTADDDRIDELFMKTHAPVLDKAVADGKLTSWGWNSHVLGGEYRRLQTMDANDFASLMKARAEVIGAIYPEGGNAEAEEFDRLCTSHSDYLWEVVHTKTAP